MRPIRRVFVVRTFLCAAVAYTLHSIVSKKVDKGHIIPEGLMFGVASSAYQNEGAWNENDKGISTWDVFTHETNYIEDGTNGDVTSDFYHKYKDDIRIAKELGFNHYRISLSWTRILPGGFANKVSKDGINFYKNVLDEIRAQGMEPFVTIYHWDHPELFDRFGGWLNELMVQYYVDYARVVFRELGSRIKYWTTVNEPNLYCNNAYGLSEVANLSPGVKLPDRGQYLCGHNMLKAHAKAYHLYDTEFRKSQGGMIGSTIHCMGAFAANESDSSTVATALAFDCGWLANPIFSKTGDYPEVMKRQIRENSLWEGHAESRLPSFTPEEIEFIKGTSDYFGLNYYTSRLYKDVPKRANDSPWLADSAVEDITSTSGWKRGRPIWAYIVPEGLTVVLKYISNELNLIPNLPIYILENGMSDNEGVDDTEKMDYLYLHIKEMLEAVNNLGIKIKAYTIWAFTDNFEWGSGYTQPFGLLKVDFNDPNRTRTLRSSAKWMQKVLQGRKLIKYNSEMNL